MSRYAKGPWLIEHGLPGIKPGYVAISSPEHTALAVAVWQMRDDKNAGEPSPRCEASARLIEAAPELVEALEALIDACPASKASFPERAKAKELIDRIKGGSQ